MIISLASYNGLYMLNLFGNYLAKLQNPYLYEQPMKWLEKNSRQGDIVFHIGWSRFPELFFWNQHNYYINGMDPIFMYKYNPSLYWEYHFLSNGQGTDYTCSNRTCTKEQSVRTYDVLVKHFKAKYITVLTGHNQTLQYLILHPKEYEKVYFDGEAAIFRIMQ